MEVWSMFVMEAHALAPVAGVPASSSSDNGSSSSSSISGTPKQALESQAEL